jgi:predicted nucleic acid-binding protein
MTELFRQDRNVAAAFITPVEITSGLWRKAGVNADLRRLAEQRYAVLEANWTIIDDYEAAVTIARRFASHYGLRAGDAIQLACAVLSRPHGEMAFVALDEDLKAAARAEGFPVLP